jgi:hypothetical protein
MAAPIPEVDPVTRATRLLQGMDGMLSQPTRGRSQNHIARAGAKDCRQRRQICIERLANRSSQWTPPRVRIIS